MMATLVFLEALTRRPNEVDASTVDTALQQGASAGGLEQASLMVALFSYMNRLVDAFGADISPQQAQRVSGVLNTVGNASEKLGGSVGPWKRFGGSLPTTLTEQLEAIRTAEGDSPADLRTALEAYVAANSGGVRPVIQPLAPEVLALADTLSEDAHGVTDQHISDLKAANWSEEAIYEMVFVACFASCIGRMERAVELLANR